MKKKGNVLWGIILVIIGLIIGCNALGITNINIFFRGWWTLFIIIPCFIGLFKENKKTGNLIGLLIGIALLLGCLNILDFDLIWKLAFPTILVIIGLSIVFKDIIGGKIHKEIKNINKKNQKENLYCAAFSSQNINIDNEKFKGADLEAVFGGIKLDLRNVKINSDIVINASSIFGGIDIYVPSNVKIKIKSTSVFGGITNKANTKNDEKNHTIYINGTAIFGGIEVK